MKKPLNILQIIVQNKMRSGGAIQLYQLSRGLVERGHRVTAIFNGEGRTAGDFSDFERSGIDLHFLSMSRLKPTKQSLDTIMELRAHIRSCDYDIIHAHKGNAVDLVMCATIGMNITIIANNGMSTPLHFFQGLKYRSPKVKKIIAVSKAVKDVMVKTGHVEPDKIQVVYGGVDTTAFNPSVRSFLRKELAIDGNGKIIGYAGSALPRKGLEYLLRAFADLAPRHPDSVLVLAGVRERDLAGNTIYESLRERIYPLGFRTDVASCMGAFDIFVFPGIHDEGLTGTVREAAAMGLPVITTDVGGNGELISDRYNGLVVPVKDSGKLAEAIDFLLADEETAQTFGRRSRQFVEQYMSADVRIKSVEDIYYNAVHGD